MSAKSNFALDVAIAAAFLVSCNPPLTGLAVHEWVGVSFGGAVAVHLLFHWNWMVQVTRRAFRRTARGSRLNYAVDAWLFVAFTATVLSGLLSRGISCPRSAWPQRRDRRGGRSTRWPRMPCWRGWECTSGCIGPGWRSTLGAFRALDASSRRPGAPWGGAPPRRRRSISRTTPRGDEREMAMFRTIGRLACILLVVCAVGGATFLLVERGGGPPGASSRADGGRRHRDGWAGRAGGRSQVSQVDQAVGGVSEEFPRRGRGERDGHSQFSLGRGIGGVGVTAVQVGLVAAVVAVMQGRSRRKAAARQGTTS